MQNNQAPNRVPHCVWGFTLFGGSVISLNLIEIKVPLLGNTPPARSSHESQTRDEIEAQVRAEILQNLRSEIRNEVRNQVQAIPSESSEVHSHGMNTDDVDDNVPTAPVEQPRSRDKENPPVLSGNPLVDPPAGVEVPPVDLTRPTQVLSNSLNSSSRRMGMRAFWSGRYSEAVSHLSESLVGSPDDAELYYFRGLARARLGDSAAAQVDFQAGGSIEVQRSAAISRSLEQIQVAHGWPERTLLEAFRP